MNQQNQSEQPNISQKTQPSIQPAIPQKPGLPTWTIVLIIVLSVAVVGLISYGTYRYFAPQPEPAELPVAGEEEFIDQITGEQAVEDECAFFEGCEIFESEKFGIRFGYKKGNKYGPSVIEERDNEIISLLPSHESYLEDCEENELCKIINNKPYSPDAGSIMIFNKPENETVNEAIQNIIEQEGKNPDDCKIVETETVSEELKALEIDSAEPIVIDDEGIEYENWMIEAGLRGKKLTDLCSKYTSGYFLYNENKSKTKFIFLSSTGMDAPFYDPASIRFVDETADWEIYRNEEYGFEIRYPENFVVRESSIVDCKGISFWDEDFSSSRNTSVNKMVTFDIFITDSIEEVEKCIGGHYSSPAGPGAKTYEFLNSEIVTINQNKFLKKYYKDIVPFEGYDAFNFSSWHIENKGTIYTLIYNNQVTVNPEPHEQLFNQILSIFKFID